MWIPSVTIFDIYVSHQTLFKHCPSSSSVSSFGCDYFTICDLENEGEHNVSGVCQQSGAFNRCKFLPLEVHHFHQYQICNKAEKVTNTIKYTQNHKITLKIH